ncbi:MAG TPA: regulatory protein RecX [Thermoanaerobaculia bacterium]
MISPDDCYLAALRILNYRFNSEEELRRKLRSKRFDRATIDETVARLRDEKWLDDERFAGAFVRTRQQKKIGPKRIERELQAAGVDRDTARRVVRENEDPDREREDLQAACAKRKRILIRRHGEAYLETAEGRKKLAAYLLNQGYDSALVQSVIKESPVADD